MNWTSLSRRASVMLLALVLVALAALAPTAAAATSQYVPGEVVVGYSAARPAGVAADVHAASTAAAPAPATQVLRLPRGQTVAQAIRRLRGAPGVAYAIPNYIAHVAGYWTPDDQGLARRAGGWQSLQWNFLPASGVNAPEAWANLIADHRPGGRGVVVAILDTGVAYRDWRQFRRSPDFARTRFVSPYDFIAGNRYPLDREGHGTFVAGTVAEATNNRFGLTGLAYGASIMPVRVLDAKGEGDAATISRGIRYAATHGARVINLSLEFDITVTSGDIPDIISAINFAHRRGVVVVAAAGNDGAEDVAYPARAVPVIAVGATTIDRCLAEYSNSGAHLALVAPGGGDDSSLINDPNCHPQRNLPNIRQMTFFSKRYPSHFGFPRDWYGTSMSSPHVAAAAALVIASGVIGRHPTPDAVLARLEQTARPLDGSKPSPVYGYGLLDAGAATAPAPPASGG